MEPVFSDAWFETFGRGDGEQTEREFAFLVACGLDCEMARAGFDLRASPSGETARMQLVFRRR